MPAPIVNQGPTDCNDIGAAGGINLGNCVQLSDGRTVASVFDQPADIVSLIVQFIFVISGFLLFVTIFYGGFKFVRSGSKGKDEAKSMISTALIGFIVIFVAYWVVRILETITGMELIF